MKREVSPFADPFLPWPVRLALAIFCLAAVGALAWALWLLWVNVQHPFPWFSTLIWGGYVGWVLWSKWRSASQRRYSSGTGPEQISPSENSN